MNGFTAAFVIFTVATVTLAVLGALVRRVRPRSVLGPLLVALAGLCLLFEIAFGVAHVVTS